MEPQSYGKFHHYWFGIIVPKPRTGDQKNEHDSFTSATTATYGCLPNMPLLRSSLCALPEVWLLLKTEGEVTRATMPNREMVNLKQNESSHLFTGKQERW